MESLIDPVPDNRSLGWVGRACGALLLSIAASSVGAQCYLPEDGERSQPPQQTPAPAGKERQTSTAPSRAQLNMVVKVRNALQRVVSADIPVVVCNSPRINAMATDRDFVIVFGGLLAIIGENENAASMVIGHEFAHVVDRHIDYNIANRERVNSEAVRAAYRASPGGARPVLGNVEAWANAAKLRYSRDLEYLADERGLQFAIAAGFNPYSAIKVYIDLITLEDQQDDTQDDHPLFTRRVARLWQLYEDELKRGKYVQQAGDQATRNEIFKARLDDLLARRRRSEATKLVDEWLVEMPESGLAWFYRGTMIRLQRPGDLRGIEALERAVTFDPNNRELWLVFCVAANKYDHRRESAHCARYLRYREDLEEHAEKVFNGRLFVGGLEQKPPKSLLIAKDEDGKKLITNDPTILSARGLSGESVAPWHLLRRPR